MSGSGVPLAEAYTTPEGLAELRGETFRAVVAASLVLAVAILALAAVDLPTRWGDFWLVVAGLAGAAFVALRLRSWSPTGSSLVLVLGLGLSAAAAAHAYPASQLAYLLPLAVFVAAILLDTAYAVALAALTSAAVLLAPTLWAGAHAGWAPGVVVALLWSCLLLCWLATRPTRVALDWSWQSYVQALRRTEELRDRQGELGRLSKSLAEACARLELMNVELERARRAAEEARRHKAEFAATISHELRTPLNLIIGFSEMMTTARHTYAGEVLPESYRADVEAIYRNACHISNLIDDVLDLSRIEVHRMALQRERTALAPIVRDAVATIGHLAGELGLALRVEVPAGLPELTVDATRIRQILINLLNNAVRSTERGSITVGAELREGDVVVAVSDTGIGFSAKDLPHLFQEFCQLGDSSRRGRSGLGLAVSKRFAELHGGSMWAESAPGRGSTFFLSLPLCDNVVATPFESAPDVAGLVVAQAAKKTVAVLGQDTEAAKLFRRYLDGYQVVCAPGARALAERGPAWGNGKAPHAVVITDERAAREWEEVCGDHPAARHVPVLTCSLGTTRGRVEELGVVDYLVKPVTRDQIAAVLGRLGAGRAVRRVLVVEDDADMARLLAKMVRSLSRRSRVRTATDGAEGLALARRERPDVVLLDLLMPEVDGYELLRQLKADRELQGVPVVVVTARERDEEPVLATALSIARPGGLTVGEVMRCAKSDLDLLLGAGPRGSAPAPPAAPSG